MRCYKPGAGGVGLSGPCQREVLSLRRLSPQLPAFHALNATSAPWPHHLFCVARR